ncbi:MAG: lipoate--protein ligase family protein [Phycisphaerae bacterium]|nr:lipoate--protein ligase family protein [Phycisphaerae bacterium]
MDQAASTVRWLTDPPLDGPANMARDEALLQRVGAGQSPPTLRFYHWSPATISMGYFQPYQDFASLPPPAGTLPVVRRQTGGGAILHDQELTYSLTLPLDHPLIGKGNANGLYDRVHEGFAAVLGYLGIAVSRGAATGACSHRGPFFCFERHSCFDLIVNGRKILGSAQRRTNHAVLQHGSLVLGRRYEQQPCAAVADYCSVAMDCYLDRLASAILQEYTGLQDPLVPGELALADQLRGKYEDPAWTRKR